MARLQVSDLMTRRVFAVREDDDLRVVRDLMDDRHVRHVPVVDERRRIVGLVSHRDLMRTALNDQLDAPLSVQADVLALTTVGEIMTRGVETVGESDDIRTAAQTMLENKYGCLPVVNGDRLIGILTEADFVKYVADHV